MLSKNTVKNILQEILISQKYIYYISRVNTK